MNSHHSDHQMNVAHDHERGWGVYQCPNACVHIALSRVTLTLTTEEFHALQALLCRARLQFDAEPLLEVGASAH